MGNYQRLHELELEIAAQDSDLVALQEIRMLGFTHAVDPDRAEVIEMMSPEEVEQLYSDVRKQYCLSDSDWRRVLGRCVASIAGTELGLSDG